MQNSWGQGSTQTSSPSDLIQSCSDGEFTAPACAPFNTLPPAPAPASSNAADHRRPTAKAPHPNELLKCPRCDSLDTKFCYFNNYSLTQPRYFCKNCKRYWTAGGALRNVPVGGGLRKNKRSKLKLAAVAAAAADAEAASAGIIARSSVAAEAPQVLDISDATPVLFAHPSGEKPSMKCQVADNLSLASHCIAEHTTHQLNGANAPTAILPPQAGNFFTKEEANAGTAFYCDPNQTSPFFPSFAASMSMPFHSAAVPSRSAPGFVVNCNVFTSQTFRDAGVSSSDVGVTGGIVASAIGTSAGEIKQEKDATQVPVSTYDWQLLSEGLFNGTGSTDSNFLYTPSSSWPDFSQFNDTGHG